jgi:acyl-CoA thioesterase
MTDLHAFDAALALAPAGEGAFTGHTHPAYANFNGQFGGITAATLLRAILTASEGGGVPVSVTVNYCAAMGQGPFTVQTRAIRRGRTLQHWSADLVQGDKVCATALVALANRASSWSHAPLTPPPAPPPQDVRKIGAGDWKGWIQQYDMHFVEGSIEHLRGAGPLAQTGSARSLLWMRHATPRALDYEGLMCMSDAFFVRMIQVRNTFPAMGTVSISTYFHCDAAALAAQGSDYLLCNVDARVFRDTFHDQSAELWSRDGVLLANTNQIVWYAE